MRYTIFEGLSNTGMVVVSKMGGAVLAPFPTQSQNCFQMDSPLVGQKPGTIQLARVKRQWPMLNALIDVWQVFKEQSPGTLEGTFGRRKKDIFFLDLYISG